MARKFAIVKFTDEDDALGIIPVNWVSDNGQFCYFPTVKSEGMKEKLIRTEAEPADQWILCPIKILHKYDTYSQARLNLRRAEDTSNLETDEDVPRKRRKRTNLFPGESDEDDDEADEAKQPKKILKKKQVIDYPSLSSFHALATPIIDSPPTSLPLEGFPSPLKFYQLIDHQSTTKSPVPSLSSSTPTVKNVPQHHGAGSPTYSATPSKSSYLSKSDRILLGQMQATMAGMAEQITSLHDKVDKLLENRSVAAEGHHAEFALLGLLPLQNMEDFETFENQIKEEDNFRNQFVKILASTGGRDIRSSVANMMRRIMTDNLAEQFSHSGKMIKDVQKIAFGSKQICCSVYVAARKMFKEQASDDKIRAVVCGWLQQAKTRKNRREDRSQKKNETNE